MPYFNCPVCGKIEPPVRVEERCTHMQHANILWAYINYMNKEDKLFMTIFDFLKSDNYKKIINKE
jgi:hypothetical protein